MVKRVSRFAVTGKVREEASDDAMSEDPRMERAMAELEREFSGLNEENPDPRQLGRMMRRMGDVMGSSWTSEMEEMARRLESGEDPDKLEERFGDSVDQSFANADEPVAADSGGSRILRKFRPAPRRDSRVYEMGDYVSETP
jgi:hypothetical protein